MITEAKNTELKLDSVIEEMTKAGLHFGHKSSKTHPGMKPFIVGIRNNVHIIDLEKTKARLEQTLSVLKEIVKEGKTILFVGTKIQLKDIVRDTAKQCGMPYVIERWIGGTFTNFDTIKKRIEYLLELERQKKEGELEKYTKREQLSIEKKMTVLEKNFGGIRDVSKLPEAIFVCDPEENDIAIKEAKKMGITIFMIADTNVNPAISDYFIPANDDAVSSVKYILEKVKEAVCRP